MRRLVVLAGVALAGCATARDREAAETWTTTKSVDEIALCLIPALNDEFKTNFTPDPEITHKIETVGPGVAYEVLPQRPVMAYGDAYVVKLFVVDGGTKVELYGVPRFSRQVRPRVESCV